MSGRSDVQGLMTPIIQVKLYKILFYGLKRGLQITTEKNTAQIFPIGTMFLSEILSKLILCKLSSLTFSPVSSPAFKRLLPVKAGTQNIKKSDLQNLSLELKVFNQKSKLCDLKSSRKL